MATIPTTVSSLSGFPPKLPVVPPNYPSGPAPGKIQLLLNSNSNYLYSKFSPYTNYHDNLLGGILSDKQPFVWTTIQKGQSGNWGSSVLGQVASLVNITPETTDDVVRVSKFLISSWGVQFLASQAVIQRSAPFDETRVYNPLSPLLATVQPLTLGLGQPPLRHIESVGSLGLLGGLANSITSTVGIDLSGGSYATPSSTVGDGALPIKNLGKGKGLIRGGDAGKALTSFQAAWTPQKQSGGGFGDLLSNAASSFLGSVASSMQSFFGGAPKSSGIVRADDSGYLIMAKSLPAILLSTNVSPSPQPWYASPTTQLDKPNPSKNKSTIGQLGAIAGTIISAVTNPVGTVIGLAGQALGGLLGSNANGSPQGSIMKSKLISFPDAFRSIPTNYGLSGPTIGGKSTGYSNQSGDPTKYRYGDFVGQAADDALTNSEMLVQYAYYAQDANKFPSKFSDNNSTQVTQVKNNLKDLINKINNGPAYLSLQIPYSYLLPNGGISADYVEYDNWTNKTAANATKPGVSGEYANNTNGKPKALDIYGSKNNNLRMATSFMSDGINMLGVLDGTRKIDNNAYYPAWKEWKPYEDDLIAFFFYDVVNDKYIPFRATVKAISEGNTAFWDELRFIGRADQLYSYNGFSRTLTFSFNVVINSITELLPTWKKINYIASAVKPSNYTTGQKVAQKFNRFIVPPMFMITIGDLYKFQPMVITSINVNIPDDASWETMNELNSNNRQGWNYLNGIITDKTVGMNYGQLPREAEIAITCNLLEKERAIVGGSHFGHEPRLDDWEDLDTDSRFVTGSADFLPALTTLHKNFVQWNVPGGNGPKTATNSSTAPSSTPTSAADNAGSTTQTVTRINRGGQTYSVNVPSTPTPQDTRINRGGQFNQNNF